MKRGRDAGKKRTGSGGRRAPAPRAPASASKARTAARAKPVPSKPAAKPAAKPAPAKPAAAKPAAAKPAAAKPGKAPPAKPAAKGAAPAKPPAKAAPRPVAPPPVVKALPKVEAPAKFRREYRKWLGRLIALRQRLRDEGNRLEEEGLKALEQEVSVDHMADYGSDSYEQDTTLALIENKSEALRDVDEAIRRIEAKTYGLCENCEQLVPAGRLEVLPHARYCVKCQAAREGVSA